MTDYHPPGGREPPPFVSESRPPGFSCPGGQSPLRKKNSSPVMMKAVSAAPGRKEKRRRSRVLPYGCSGAGWSLTIAPWPFFGGTSLRRPVIPCLPALSFFRRSSSRSAVLFCLKESRQLLIPLLLFPDGNPLFLSLSELCSMCIAESSSFSPVFTKGKRQACRVLHLFFLSLRIVLYRFAVRHVHDHNSVFFRMVDFVCRYFAPVLEVPALHLVCCLGGR